MHTYGASQIAQLVKDMSAMQETQFDSWVRKIHWRRDRLPSPVFLGFPCGSAGKESACKMGDLGLIPGLGRAPGGFYGLYSPWGLKESDMTERVALLLSHAYSFKMYGTNLYLVSTLKSLIHLKLLLNIRIGKCQKGERAYTYIYIYVYIYIYIYVKRE